MKEKVVISPKTIIVLVNKDVSLKGDRQILTQEDDTSMVRGLTVCVKKVKDITWSRSFPIVRSL